MTSEGSRTGSASVNRRMKQGKPCFNKPAQIKNKKTSAI